MYIGHSVELRIVPNGSSACSLVFLGILHGDLSKFGKIDHAGLQFGPSSVFSKCGDKGESASVICVSPSSNVFAILNSSEATPDAVSVGSGRGPFTGMADLQGPRPSSEDRFAQATRNLGDRGVPFPLRLGPVQHPSDLALLPRRVLLAGRLAST